MASYVLINKETNIADSAVAWDGNIETWQPPETHLALLLDTIPAVDWVWNEETTKWIAVEGIGNGGIGDVWDGEKLVQPYPPLIEESTGDN